MKFNWRKTFSLGLLLAVLTMEFHGLAHSEVHKQGAHDCSICTLRSHTPTIIQTSIEIPATKTTGNGHILLLEIPYISARIHELPHSRGPPTDPVA